MHKHLQMEEEVMDLLIGGFSVVMLIATMTVVSLWRKNRTRRLAFYWIFAHFLLLSIAAYFAFRAISFDLTHPQASEEISLLLGKAGLAWGAGMVCLLAGIVKLSRR
ncbi:hypothetical protein B9L19_14745 [Geobacillus thermocatenulatus]|uniref:Uncharacterized protein n=1 Tax=Geobacillus thermocatenulatus TaxID=33938 RepID=A0A226Q333_9BACL|nr:MULTISPECIES: hypothetical protein [Geobacillus]AST00359.1 hypothetical protein GT3921_15780 [Geobacillus thermocatenulatus]KLR72135.1 hypothetical protein ABH20_18120 [Geobacillus sp. T6]OXB86746.1 hypothetical protein B9L19_14745 [Geobacillus thermocatenulatus]RAN30128.1 hypothetical protein VC88_03880 [Geobacillus sp. A8]